MILSDVRFCPNCGIEVGTSVKASAESIFNRRGYLVGVFLGLLLGLLFFVGDISKRIHCPTDSCNGEFGRSALD